MPPKMSRLPVVSESTPLTVSFAKHETGASDDDGDGSSTGIESDTEWSPETVGAVGLPQQHKHKTNQLETFLHLVKGSVNSGCYSLPWAFSSLGLPLGAFSTAMACIVTTYNCILLVRLKNRVCPGQELTYGDVAKAYFGEGFGNFVAFSVSLQQLSICMVYFSFVGVNISSVTQHMSSFVDLSYENLLFISLPIALGLTLMPNLKMLAPVTGLASVLMLGAFASFTAFMFVTWNGLADTLPLHVDWPKAPMAMCALLFSFEGVCLVLPIESAMQTPAKFERTIQYSNTVVCIIFITLASSSVLAFGEVDNGSVTAFLMDHIESYPRGRLLILAANALVSCSVLFTFPLQIFPSIGLTAQAICKVKQYFRNRDINNIHLEDDNADVEKDFAPLSRKSSMMSKGTELSVAASTKEIEEGDSPVLRVSLVLFCWIVASLIPNVGQLIALSGAFAGSMNALVTPPVLQLRFLWQEKYPKFGYESIQCYILLSGGLALGTIGSYFSVLDVYESFQNKN